MAAKGKLNTNQEKFCKLYVSQEFFGNGVESYLQIYKPDKSKPNWYKSSCSAASRLLSSVKVCARINELLDSAGLNDQFVDKQLLFLITQHDDKSAKQRAIAEYNKLKRRITDKVEQEVTHKWADMTDDDLDRAIKARQDRIS